MMLLLISALCFILLSGQVTTIEKLSGTYLGQKAPGSVPVRFARGVIPDDLHSVPIFSKDGKSMYFKSMDDEGIMVSEDDGNHWSPPEPVFSNSDLNNSDDPCLSYSGDKFFFSSYNKEANRDYIYCCSIEKGGLSQPEQPEGNVNTLDLHWQFSMAGNGNIYFASTGNIYCSELDDGIYHEPYKMDSCINTNLSECTPYVSPEEDILIFSRSVEGKPDLYISHKDKNGHWGASKALPNPINTEHHEMCPHITADGKYFFFISSREGLFSAYWMDADAILTN